MPPPLGSKLFNPELPFLFSPARIGSNPHEGHLSSYAPPMSTFFFFNVISIGCPIPDFLCPYVPQEYGPPRIREATCCIPSSSPPKRAISLLLFHPLQDLLSWHPSLDRHSSAFELLIPQQYLPPFSPAFASPPPSFQLLPPLAFFPHFPFFFTLDPPSLQSEPAASPHIRFFVLPHTYIRADNVKCVLTKTPQPFEMTLFFFLSFPTV